MLPVNTPRVHPPEIAPKFLVRWRILKRVSTDDLQKSIRTLPQTGSTEQLSVLQGTLLENQRPGAHSGFSSSSKRRNSSSDKNSSSGLFAASRIDSRTPGIEVR